MSQPTASSSSYESVMIFYLAVGAAGLLFAGGILLSEVGWLETAIRTIFGDQGDAVLEMLYGLGIVITFALGFYLVVGWIPAIWITIRYRGRWPIWAPSAYFLLIEGLLLLTLDSSWAMEASFEWVTGVLIGVYFLVTLVVGLQMFSQRKSPRPPPVVINT